MAIKPIETPLTKMSFTPDVPPAALGPNEYNDGLNVETDVRGIQKIQGDVEILSQVPGTIVFVTANYRQGTQFWFICATTSGAWYGVTSSGITTLTPTDAVYTGTTYTSTSAITADWNGDVCFIMDNRNAPMYLSPTDARIKIYDQSYAGQTPNVYVWNYYTSSGWADLTAGFIRVYSSPNVGSVLVCGNLTYDIGGTTYNLPNTIRWSQAFGLNSGPTSWEPTVTNVANETEVPVRGPLIDGFALNGNFYMFSYWDCAMLAPIAYTSSAAPVFGVMPVTKGRGMLNENCWAIADEIAFGVDARDIWVLKNGIFDDIGNQRIKNWFYSNLNASYIDNIFMVNNTYKNQIEIYYPDTTSTGLCNKMISYRYDLDAWNPPRDVEDAVAGVESPRYTANVANNATRGVVYAPGTGANLKLIQKDAGRSFINSGNINSYFQRDSIGFGQPYNNKIQVHRVLPEVYGTGNVVITVGGADSVGANVTYKPNVTLTINTDDPWCQINQNDSRVVTLKVGSNDNTNYWVLPQVNWQVSVIEDTR